MAPTPPSPRRLQVTKSENGDDDYQRPVQDGAGRLRSYLNPENGRSFDPDDPTTSEGRLVDPQSLSWHMPSGEEGWMQRRTGARARDVRAGDVGRFKLSDFSTRASDERGHDKTVKVSMPPQMLNELHALVDAKVFPVRNVEALARTLVYEGMLLLHQIAKQDSLMIPNSHMEQLDALAIVGRNMESILAYDEMLMRNCELVRELLSSGVRNKARASVYEMLDLVERINSKELRARWTKQIKSEFGHMLRGSGGARAHLSKTERARLEILKRRDRDEDGEGHEHDHDVENDD